jgi:hypothetical protein
MKTKLLLLLFALLSLACRVSVDLFETPALATPIGNAPPSPTPQFISATFTPALLPATPTLLPPSPSAPALSLEQLKNASYLLQSPAPDGSSNTVTLTDGLYLQGGDSSQPGYVSVTLAGITASGDLNGDAAPDAAVILAENYGGTGVFTSVVAVLNQGGQPFFGASAYLDDRAIINAIQIENGEILLDAVIHGMQDPGCCPTLATRQTYRYWQNSLSLAGFSTQTPAGDWRTIQITTPVNGAEMEKVFTLSGTVSIAPFENNLGYQVYIPGMTEPFTQGAITVNAPDFGAPGTFELPLNFSASGYTGPVRIALVDLSAADGSLLALDALFVQVK